MFSVLIKMFNIILLLLISASIVPSEQLNRRTIVDIPLTRLDSRFNEENKINMDNYDINKLMAPKESEPSYSFQYRVQLKHKKKKQSKKHKLYEFKYRTACTCRDWKCDWRRTGDSSDDGNIERASRYRDDVFEVITFLNTLHKYYNRLRGGNEKINLQRNCQCLRKVCPTRSWDDFEDEMNTHDISEDQDNSMINFV